MCQIAMEAISPTLCLLIVSGGSVWFAFSRFKREKMWERRFSAYVDAINLLSSMLTITGRRVDEISGTKTYSSKSKSNDAKEYLSLEREFNNITAIAGVILSRNCSEILKKLSLDIEINKNEDPLKDIPDRYLYIESALTALTEEGRRELN